MEKRGFVLLISLLFIVSMGATVFAANEPFVDYNLENATLQNVTNSTGTQLTRFGGGFFLRNSTVHSPFISNNQTYQLNITINNSATVDNNFMTTISNITVELPTGLLFGGVALGAQNITDFAGQEILDANFNNVYNTTTSVTWNGSVLMNSTSIAQSSSGAIIVFNVTIDDATAAEGAGDIIIRISNNSLADKKLNAVTFNYTLSSNVTLDFTAPTITAASTNNSLNLINVTFSENIDGGSLNNNMFNITSVLLPSGVVAQATSQATAVQSGFATDSNSILVTLNESYAANATPLLSLNFSSLTDRAGNALVVDHSTGHSTVNATAADQAMPGIVAAGLVASASSYNHFNGQLVVQFNETIDTSSYDGTNVTIHDNESITTEFVTLNNTGDTVNTGSSSNFLNVTIAALDIDKVSGLRASGLLVNLTTGAIKDNAGNAYRVDFDPTVTNFTINSYTNDTEGGNITSVSYNESTGEMIITFNETMDPNLIDLATVYVRNVSAQGVDTDTSINGATIDKANNDTTVTLTLGVPARNNISYMINGDSTPTIYLVYNTSANANFKDIGGIAAADLKNNQTDLTTVTLQTTGAQLIRYPHMNTTFGNVLGQRSEHTKADEVNFSLHFNDVVATDPASFGTVKIIHAGGAEDTASCTSINRSVVNCTVSISTGDDGAANISVSGLKMANGVTSVATNASNIVFVDTVSPTLVKVAYHDHDYNEANRTFDNVLIEFNENVTSATGSAVRATTTERLVISAAANDIFNLTVTGDVFNGSGAHSGGGGDPTRLSSYAAGANFRAFLNLSYVNITLNDTVNFTQRGLFDPAAEKEGNISGLRLGVGQDIISDYAGNLAATNGRHDIADGIVQFTANQLKYFSVPFCVDQDDISNQTGTATGSIKSFSQSGFTTITSGQVNPLLGYEANITRDFNLFVHTKSKANCAIVAHSTSINQNFTLLGVDNSNRTNATNLFASLGDGAQVNNLYPTPNTIATIETSVAQYNARTFDPFTAYWVFPDFDTSSKNFNGLGIN